MEKGLDKADLTRSEPRATSRSGVPCVAGYRFAMEIGSGLIESFFSYLPAYRGPHIGLAKKILAFCVSLHPVVGPQPAPMA